MMKHYFPEVDFSLFKTGDRADIINGFRDIRDVFIGMLDTPKQIFVCHFLSDFMDSRLWRHVEDAIAFALKRDLTTDISDSESSTIASLGVDGWLSHLHLCLPTEECEEELWEDRFKVYTELGYVALGTEPTEQEADRASIKFRIDWINYMISTLEEMK